MVAPAVTVALVAAVAPVSMGAVQTVRLADAEAPVVPGAKLRTRLAAVETVVKAEPEVSVEAAPTAA